LGKMHVVCAGVSVDLVGGSGSRGESVGEGGGGVPGAVARGAKGGGVVGEEGDREYHPVVPVPLLRRPRARPPSPSPPGHSQRNTEEGCGQCMWRFRCEDV